MFLFAALTAIASAAPSVAGPVPTPPAVDFSSVPKSADVQKVMPDKKKHPVRARLLSDKATVAAGETFRLGVHLEQDKGWHTYWKSPGEIGLPTDIKWTLPGSAKATAYEYPVPGRFFDPNVGASFGYDDQVLLFTEVSVPADLAPGSHEFKASANWLVCEKQCIPGNADLVLPIEVVASGPTPGPHAPLFDHFESRHPTPAPDGVTIDAKIEPPAIVPNKPFKATFTITGIDAPAKSELWPTFTPIAGFEWMINEAKAEVLPNGVRVTLDAEAFDPKPLPKDDKVGGLFQVKKGGEWVRTEYTTPLPWTKGQAETAVVPKDKVERGKPELDLAAIGTPALDEATCAAVIGQEAASGGGIGNALLMLAMAFVGGLILNIMPCVLPVLTLKLYGLVEQVDATPRDKQIGGLAYTGGILASFLVLAIAVVVLQNVFDTQVAWGFQFQYPGYVAALATIVFVFGLSLFGVFELPAIGSDAAAAQGHREGPAGYFMTGVFATLLATPCSAPFLGTAMGFAFAQPSAFVVLFFLVAGLGLASPFLLVAFVPAAYRMLPAPGEWMETFKQFMGFTLMATTVWLIDVLAGQISIEGVIGFVAFLTVAGMGAWVFGRWGGLGATGSRQAAAAVVAVAITALGWTTFVDLSPADHSAPADDSGKIAWKKFDDVTVASLLNRYREGDDVLYDGRPVLLDFTADWCFSCKVFERTVLNTDAVAEAVEKNNAVPIKADWTNKDEDIHAWLTCFGVGGVPYYAVLPADPTRKAILLGETVTQSSVTAALEQAAR